MFFLCFFEHKALKVCYTISVIKIEQYIDGGRKNGKVLEKLYEYEEKCLDNFIYSSHKYDSEDFLKRDTYDFVFGLCRKCDIVFSEKTPDSRVLNSLQEYKEDLNKYCDVLKSLNGVEGHFYNMALYKYFYMRDLLSYIEEGLQ